MEFLGRKFSTVDKGIDPKEVVEFLKGVSGSSEDVFERLEQFSVLQSAAKTMEDSISQAKRLAEYAKKQAESEAQQRKAQAAEEAGRQAMSMIDRVKESCISSIDSAHDIMLTAIRASLDDAKETVSSNLAQIGESIEKAAKERLDKWQVGALTSDEHLVRPQAETGEVALSDKQQEDMENEKAVPDLINIHGSSTGLDKNDNTSARIPEAGLNSDKMTETEGSSEYEEGKVVDVPDSAGTDIVEATEGLYSGNVTVIIPRGVQDTWMKQFRNHLSRTAGVKIQEEAERDKERIEVVLSLDKPIDLLQLLQDLPNVRKVMESWNTETPPEGRGSGRVNRASRKSEEVALILQFA